MTERISTRRDFIKGFGVAAATGATFFLEGCVKKVGLSYNTLAPNGTETSTPTLEKTGTPQDTSVDTTEIIKTPENDPKIEEAIAAYEELQKAGFSWDPEAKSFVYKDVKDASGDPLHFEIKGASISDPKACNEPTNVYLVFSTEGVSCTATPTSTPENRPTSKPTSTEVPPQPTDTQPVPPPPTPTEVPPTPVPTNTHVIPTATPNSAPIDPTRAP